MSMWDWDEEGETEPPRERQYRDPYASHSGSSDYHGYGGHQSQSDHSHHQHAHAHGHGQHNHGHGGSGDSHANHRHGASPSRQNYGQRHESYEDQGDEDDSYGSQSHGRPESYQQAPAHNMARAPAAHSANYGGHQGYDVSAGYENRQEHRAPAPASHGHEPTGRSDLFTSDSVVNLTLDEIDALARTHRSRSWLVVLYAPWCRFCQAMEPNFERVARHLERSDVYVGRFRADGDHKEYAKRYLQLEHFPTVLFFPKDSSNIVKYTSENREVDALLGFVRNFH